MVGPVMGSVINGLVGYEWTFYVFAIILGAASVFCFVALPSRLNEIEEVKDDESQK